MKVIKFYILIFLLSFQANSQSQNNLIGEWNVIDYWGNESKMVFSEDGFVSMFILDEFIDGRDFEAKSINSNTKKDKGQLKYEVSRKKNSLNNIDIIAYSITQDKIVGKIYGIYQIVSESEVKMVLNFSGKRHNDLDDTPKEEVITLLKVD